MPSIRHSLSAVLAVERKRSSKRFRRGMYSGGVTNRPCHEQAGHALHSSTHDFVSAMEFFLVSPHPSYRACSLLVTLSEAPQNVLQDATVSVVVSLTGRIDTQTRIEGNGGTVFAQGFDRQSLRGYALIQSGDTVD